MAFNDKYRFVLDNKFQVFPTNTNKVTLRWEQESEELFWRQKLNGKLVFTAGCCRGYEGAKDTGMPIVDGWQYLHKGKLEYDCKRFYIDIEVWCDGSWQTIYSGYFTKWDCDWDEDNCVVEAKVLTNDRYECFLKNYDVKQNLYDIVDDQYSPQANELYTWFSTKFINLDDGGKPDCADLEADHPGICDYGWICSKGWKDGNKWRNMHIYVKECSRVKIDSSFELDPDTGFYCRPYSSSTSNRYIDCGGAFGGSNPNPNDPKWGHAQNANGNGDSFWFYNRGFEYYTGNNIPGSLKHRDVVSAFVSRLGCNGVRSYWNDMFNAVSNPVTGEKPNPLNDLYVIQKSNVVRFYASNPATVFELSFKEYLKYIKHMFQAYLFIDSTGRVTLKHISEVNTTTGIDLIAREGGKYINGLKKYSYNRADMPSREEWELGDDTLNYVEYDSKCTSPEVIKKYTETQIFTDIKNMLGNEDAGLTGVVFAVVDPSTNQILNNNEYLRMQNLIRRYWREKRPAINGMMKRQTTFTANTTLRVKEQKQIEFPDCCITFDPTKTILTQLGSGEVKEAEYSLLTGTITVKLLHDE